MAMSEIKQLTPLGHAFAGALGGVFSNTVVYPLDTAKTVIQATRTDKSGKGRDHPVRLRMISLLRRIYQEEGISGFYKGYAATMLNTFSTQYAYFFFYSFVRSNYIKRVTRKLPVGSPIPALSTAAELLLGALAGALAQIFTIPVSVIAVRQQLAHSSFAKPSPSLPEVVDEKQSPPSDHSFTGVAKQIIDEDGITGLWRGLKPSLVLTANPAITYGIFERVKSIILMGSTASKISPWTAFTLGALSKTLATVVTYPYIMAKVRIQAGVEKTEIDELPTSNGGQKQQEKGAVGILTDVFNERGLSGWYQGMSSQILKAVLTQAILFVSKEQIELYALVLLNMYARMRRRVST